MTRPGDLAACERLIREVEAAGWGWTLTEPMSDGGFLVFVNRRGDYPAVCRGRGPTLFLALEEAFHTATRGLLEAQLEASRALLASNRVAARHTNPERLTAGSLTNGAA